MFFVVATLCSPYDVTPPLGMQVTRGIEKTVNALVKELKALSNPITSDKDLQDVATVSAGNNPEIGALISEVCCASCCRLPCDLSSFCTSQSGLP